MSRGKPPGWSVFLAARWKAVAATAVPLIGGVLFLISTGEFDFKHLAGILAVSLGSGTITHVVPNVGTAPVQETVDAVLDAIPPTLVPDVAAAVSETTTGVLATAVGTVSAVLPDPTEPSD